MNIKKQLKLVILMLALIMPLSSVFANARVSMMVKNPDPQNNNQTWFKYTQEAGTTINDSVVLKNLGPETESLTLYAADATSNNAGSFILKFPEEKQAGLGAWTQLSATKVTLKPQEMKEVPFSITIPGQLAPGDYAGGIVMEKNLETISPLCESNGKDCNAEIKIKTRIGNRIYLTIPGETIADISWENFYHKSTATGKVNFHFKFTNNGNVAFEPHVTIAIKDITGKIVDTIESNIGEAMPKTTIEPSISWNNKTPFGYFNATANVIFKEKHPSQNGDDKDNDTENLRGSAERTSRSLNFLIIPWNLILMILTVLGCVTVYFSYRNHQKLKLIKICSDYRVSENENIADIAKKHGVHWETVAMVNSLKPPFVLQKGQKIKIPPKLDKATEIKNETHT